MYLSIHSVTQLYVLGLKSWQGDAQWRNKDFSRRGGGGTYKNKPYVCQFLDRASRFHNYLPRKLNSNVFLNEYYYYSFIFW